MDFSTKWASGTKERNLFTIGEPMTQRQFFYREYFKQIKDVADKLPKTARILEIGCGRGTILQYLRSEGFENITGMDNSDEALALARENLGYGVKLIKGEALDLPFTSQEFDLVISMGVSEHVDNYPKFFYEQLRVLKLGGWLVCMTVPRKFSAQILNIFGSDKYYRSRNSVAQYETFLNKMTDHHVISLWLNPYPLFTPISPRLECAITKLYKKIHWLRGTIKSYPFHGSGLLCQSHFLITRRSS